MNVNDSMTEKEKCILLEKSKDFFKKQIVKSHIDRIKKLGNLNEFNINPFLHEYISQSMFGNVEDESLAKALILPRAFGTSINTIFGTQMQSYCSEVLNKSGSIVSGMDIEFYDFIDKKKKYCQVKSGPNTINKDDVTTIISHFKSAKRLGQTNNMKLDSSNFVVGVLYGTDSELSNHYKKISQDYDVYVGKEFWFRLTGDVLFYDKLKDVFSEAARESQMSNILEETIKHLSQEIKEAKAD